MSRGEFTVALVGRPNVGKSTLFNRMARKRRAITFDQPGITRDLVAEPVEYDGRHFLLVDTGGYMTGGGDDDLLPKIRGQVLRAVYESDLVVFLVDSRDGLLPLDKEIAGMLRERGKAGPARREQGGREGRQGRRFPVPRPLRRYDPCRFRRARHGDIRTARGDRRADSRPDRRRGSDGREGRRPSADRRGGAAERGKVDARQHAGGVRAGHRLGDPRHHARRDRRDGGAGRKEVPADRHRGDPREAEDRRRCRNLLRDEEPRLDQAVRPRDPADRRPRGAHPSGPAGPALHPRRGARGGRRREQGRRVDHGGGAPQGAARDRGRARIRFLRACYPHGGHFGKRIPAALPEDRGGQRELSPARPDGPAEPDGAVVPLHRSDPVPAGEEPRFLHDAGRGRPALLRRFREGPPGIPDSFTRYLQNKIRDRFGFEGSPVRVVYRER